MQIKKGTHDKDFFKLMRKANLKAISKDNLQNKFINHVY